MTPLLRAWPPMPSLGNCLLDEKTSSTLRNARAIAQPTDATADD